MSPTTRIATGLAVALLLGWIWEGPLGKGAAFVDRLDTDARAVVADAGVAGVTVSIQRGPLARSATLSGPADDFQRNGQGIQKGLTERVADVPGMGAVGWSDEPSRTRVFPLLIETLLQIAIGYAIGLGLAWLLWRRRDSYIY
jgi:hypothetical protein